MCSMEPAIDPATMNCQKWRPSWGFSETESSGISGWKSVGARYIGEASVVVVVVAAIVVGVVKKGQGGGCVSVKK